MSLEKGPRLDYYLWGDGKRKSTAGAKIRSKKTVVTMNTTDLVKRAHEAGMVIPAFNVPHIPVMEPVVRALRDTECMGLIAVARLEIFKFKAKSLATVREEYERVGDEEFTRLHLDHVPVIDEDNVTVDYAAFMREAIDLGFQSVMLDGSRLPLQENIECTRRVVEMSHEAGIPVEAELGAVLGHEKGPLPPYEELFSSGRGFTSPEEAARFVKETGVDWLSVAIGNVHGAVAKAARDKKKVEARLNIEHLDRIRSATGIPLVLHGGSGIRKEYIIESFRHGIAKINIGTTVRQAYERGLATSVQAGRDAVYETTRKLITDELEIAGSAKVLKD